MRLADACTREENPLWLVVGRPPRRHAHLKLTRRLSSSRNRARRARACTPEPLQARAWLEYSGRSASELDEPSRAGRYSFAPRRSNPSSGRCRTPRARTGHGTPGSSRSAASSAALELGSAEFLASQAGENDPMAPPAHTVRLAVQDVAQGRERNGGSWIVAATSPFSGSSRRAPARVTRRRRVEDVTPSRVVSDRSTTRSPRCHDRF